MTIPDCDGCGGSAGDDAQNHTARRHLHTSAGLVEHPIGDVSHLPAYEDIEMQPTAQDLQGLAAEVAAKIQQM